MNPSITNPVIDLLPRHRSIRKFSSKPVDDEAMHNYYKSRDSNLKDQTWTGQMAELTGRIIRPQMKSFLEKKGFFRQ